MQELQAQNQALSKRVDESNEQVKNLTYNMQGFVDENAFLAPPKAKALDLTPPGLFFTVTPAIINDAQEVGEGEDTSSLFPTATGAEMDSSVRETNMEEARTGGSVKIKLPVGEEEEQKSRKTAEEQAKARELYHGTPSLVFPARDAPAGRWRWAIRKVIFLHRLRTQKVDLTRGKVKKHDTFFAKMKRMEDEVFEIPISLRKHVKEETTILNERIDVEVKTLNEELATQKKETQEMGERLQGGINETNTKVADVDSRLKVLQDQVDNANAQADEIEQKLDKVIARVSEGETALFTSIKGRVQEASEKVAGLLTSSGSINGLAKTISEFNNKMSDGSTYDNDADRMEKESEKLFETLTFETTLRNSRLEIGLLDTNSFALGEILRQIRREVLAHSVLAGGEYEDIIAKESVNEILAFVDSAQVTVDQVFEVVQTANSLFRTHDNLLGARWGVLQGMAEAVKNVSGIADAIVDMQAKVEVLPTLEKVKELATEIVTTALVPIDEKISESSKVAIAAEETATAVGQKLDTLDEELKKSISATSLKLDEELNSLKEHIKEQIASAPKGNGLVSTMSAGPGTGGDLESQLEPMVKEIVEMYVDGPSPGSRGGTGATQGEQQTMADFFGQSSEAADEGGSDNTELFLLGEIELVFEKAVVAVDDISDELLDDDNSVNKAVDAAHAAIKQGCLVKVLKSGSDFEGRTGIVIAVLEEGEGSVIDPSGSGSAEEKESNSNQEPEGEGDPAKPIASQIRYRVAITPKTPYTPGGAENGTGTVKGLGDNNNNNFMGMDGEGLDSFQSLSLSNGNSNSNSQGGSNEVHPATGDPVYDSMSKQINKMARRIEDIIQGKFGSISGGSPQAGANGGAGVSAMRGNSPPSNETRGVSFGRNSSNNNNNNNNGGGGGGGFSMDTGTIMEMIQESMASVSAELGDLRESSHRELGQAKNQMKKAIMQAINKAIVEEGEKDKPAMLTTKQLCLGCGRPSLVRGQPFDESLHNSNAFNPGLNANILEGPDIYRSGFKMPVNRGNSVKNLQLTAGTVGFSEDSLFGEEEEESQSQAGGNTISTYSEILAGLEADRPLSKTGVAGVTSVTDLGPGGMSISISSQGATSPLPQRMPAAAKSIRHAQGREEVAMLRPIHRKGMGGGKSERARNFVNKSHAPERFDGASYGDLSPQVNRINIPTQRATASVGGVGGIGMNDVNASTADGKFHP